MPWMVDIEKLLVAEYWTNRYVVEAPDIQAAGVVAATILEAERKIHSTAITFTRYRVDDGVPNTDASIIVPANVQGLRVTGGGRLPLWNVAVCDFSVALGRPARKYLRVGLEENDVTGEFINDGLVVQFNADYATPLAAHQAYVNVDGQAILSGAFKPRIGMRQLRRGSKRRVTPVLPVA
jgi:hypothetical protein